MSPARTGEEQGLDPQSVSPAADPPSVRPGFCVRRSLLPPPPSAPSLRLAWISPLVFPAARRQLSPSRAQRGPARALSATATVGAALLGTGRDSDGGQAREGQEGTQQA